MADGIPDEKKADAKDDKKIACAPDDLFVTLKHVLNIVMVLGDNDIQILKTYVRSRADLSTTWPKAHHLQGQGPYAAQLKKIENDIKEVQKRMNEKLGEV
jgi:hypothetical protein